LGIVNRQASVDADQQAPKAPQVLTRFLTLLGGSVRQISVEDDVAGSMRRHRSSVSYQLGERKAALIDGLSIFTTVYDFAMMSER